MSTNIHFAQDLLGRHIPAHVGGDAQPEAQPLISAAQKLLSNALAAGDVRVARWLCTRFQSAQHNDLPGIVAQLRPLVDHLVPVAKASREIACLAIPMARDLGHSELYRAALIGAREALKAG